MRTRSEVIWDVIQSTPLTKSDFLKSILNNKFPKYSFNYKRFYPSEAVKKSSSIAGVIAELKSLTEASLTLFDKFYREYKSTPLILVLTPAGYQLLTKRRKKILDQTMIVLSETKSLDYLIQLPRFIGEASKKRRLKAQNERLQRLIEKSLPHLSHFSTAHSLTDFVAQVPVIDEVLSRENGLGRSMQCGLKITFKNWAKMKSRLGHTARGELIDVLSRAINGVVRNSDRVMRSQEDEFLVFLSTNDPNHTARCKERLESALKNFSLFANDQKIRLPFTVKSVDHASFH